MPSNTTTYRLLNLAVESLRLDYRLLNDPHWSWHEAIELIGKKYFKVLGREFIHFSDTDRGDWEFRLSGKVYRGGTSASIIDMQSQLTRSGWIFQRHIPDLGHSKLILDVGANVGFFSLMVQRLAPTAQIIAFEPQHAIFKKLQSNASKTNIECVNLALSDRAGELLMAVDPLASDRGSIGSTGFERVVAVTLDDFLRDREFNIVVDLLKIDVESHELAVLRGARETLRRTKRVWIEVTVSGNTAYTVPQLMREFSYPDASFQLVAIRNWSNKAEGSVPVMECLLVNALLVA